MGCGCGGRKKKISVIRNRKIKGVAQSVSKKKKCPNCGSYLITINKYSKKKKSMVSSYRCSNRQCDYVK